MNFAVLGDHPAVLSLVRAIAAAPEHRVEHVALADQLLPQLLEIAPGIRVHSDWDELLLAASLDMALVAGHSDDVLFAARQLAAGGKPLVLFPDAAQGSTFIYELTLIRDDANVLLFPVFPLRFDPSLKRLKDLLRIGALGDVVHIQIERELPPSSGGTLLLTPDDVDAALLHDADVLRFLGGNYNQVTALYTGRTESGLSMATVTLAGSQLAEASWSARTGNHPMRRLTVTGQSGTAVVEFGNGRSELRLTVGENEQAFAAPASAMEFGPELLKQIEDAVAEESVQPDWTDATRAFEIVDGAHRSLTRRRTIDLHFETTSERSIFKTQMTAIGCGVLVFTLLALVAFLIVGTLLDNRDEVVVRADAAGFLIRADEFDERSADLTPQGRQHVRRIAPRMDDRTIPVVIEESDEAGVAGLNEQRRQTVIKELKALGVDEAADRTVVASTGGQIFGRFLQFARFLWLLPLLVFLLLQLLLFIAKPSVQQSASPGEPS